MRPNTNVPITLNRDLLQKNILATFHSSDEFDWFGKINPNIRWTP